jgi:hypothetical protein
MSRFVVPQKPGLASGSSEAPDGFGARLAKYIPAEIMSIYTIAIGGLVSSKPDPDIAPYIALGLIVVFLFATFVYFARLAPSKESKRAHLVASPIAFVAWAYPLSAPLIGTWFIGWVAIIGQTIAALVAWLVAPSE